MTDKPMFKFYEVTFQFRDRLMGGIPRNEEVIKAWLEARTPARMPVDGTPVATLVEEVVSTVEAAEDKVWSGFQRDEGGLFVRSDHVKAHLKDCANVIKEWLQEKAFRSKIADRVYVTPARASRSCAKASRCRSLMTTTSTLCTS